jgi:hypothetical protein
MVDTEQEIKELRQEIEELKAALPAHSVPAGTLIRLEELEERLGKLEAGERDASA